jgi:CheY-like chemotaxis protein
MTQDTSLRPILLVEDNPVDIDLTRRAFRRRSLLSPLEVARDGEDALARLASWERGQPVPAVILLDLKLPRVDGLEVLRRIRAHPRFGTLAVVVLTSSAEHSDVQAAYEAGASSYIVKPIDFEQFVTVCQHIEAYWGEINLPPVVSPE